MVFRFCAPRSIAGPSCSPRFFRNLLVRQRFWALEICTSKITAPGVTPKGRLIWGINDFDEACPLPYTNDLVRLATSAWLAIEADALGLRRETACSMILEGYSAALATGGRLVVLSERNRWLHDAVTSR